MSMPWRFVPISGFLTIALAGAFAGEPVLTRDGKYWVEVRSGAESVAPSAHLHITSRGPVTLNGMSNPAVSYTLKIRVKAPSAEEARQLAKHSGVRVARQGANAAYLVVQRGEGMVDLQVNVPRQTADLTIGTSEGAVAFYDLQDGAVEAETGGVSRFVRTASRVTCGCVPPAATSPWGRWAAMPSAPRREARSRPNLVQGEANLPDRRR